MNPMCPTMRPKSVVQAMLRRLAEAVRKKDKDEAGRLKRELRKAGVNLVDAGSLKTGRKQQVQVNEDGVKPE
jgi:hypothetical protein